MTGEDGKTESGRCSLGYVKELCRTHNILCSDCEHFKVVTGEDVKTRGRPRIYTDEERRKNKNTYMREWKKRHGRDRERVWFWKEQVASLQSRIKELEEEKERLQSDLITENAHHADIMKDIGKTTLGSIESEVKKALESQRKRHQKQLAAIREGVESLQRCMDEHSHYVKGIEGYCDLPCTVVDFDALTDEVKNVLALLPAGGEVPKDSEFLAAARFSSPLSKGTPKPSAKKEEG